jgi:hypothetical protein
MGLNSDVKFPFVYGKIKLVNVHSFNLRSEPHRFKCGIVCRTNSSGRSPINLNGWYQVDPQQNLLILEEDCTLKVSMPGSGVDVIFNRSGVTQYDRINDRYKNTRYRPQYSPKLFTFDDCVIQLICLCGGLRCNA